MPVKASAYLEEARRLLAKLKNEGDPAWRVFHFYSARVALEQRRYDDAVTAARAALRLSRRAGDRSRSQPLRGRGSAR